MSECEGNCGFHYGEVRRVRVWYGFYDWGFFNYCDTAIEIDRGNGFTVIKPELEDGVEVDA